MDRRFHQPRRAPGEGGEGGDGGEGDGGGHRGVRHHHHAATVLGGNATLPWNLPRLYGVISLLGAIFAIVSAPGAEEGFHSSISSHSNNNSKINNNDTIRNVVVVSSSNSNSNSGSSSHNSNGSSNIGAVVIPLDKTLSTTSSTLMTAGATTVLAGSSGSGASTGVKSWAESVFAKKNNDVATAVVTTTTTTTTISQSFFSPRILRRNQRTKKNKNNEAKKANEKNEEPSSLSSSSSAAAAAVAAATKRTIGGVVGSDDSWGGLLTRFIVALAVPEEVLSTTIAAKAATTTTTTTTSVNEPPVSTSTGRASTASTSSNHKQQQQQQESPPLSPPLPGSSNNNSNSNKLSWIDPCILQFTAQTPTDLMDKVLSSYARLLLIANWLLACTVLMHSAIAEFFLGPDASSHEPIGIYLCFKLLLISAVVAQDHLDWLILLSWYTCLQFLRSLHSLSSNAIANARGSGQIPRPGVWKLLLTILALDGVACATCVGLLHEAGLCMILVLTCDCLLLAIDVLTQLMQCQTVVNEFRHQEHMAVLEHEQLLGYDRDLDIEQLERRRMHQATLLDGGIFWLQFLFDMITIFHYLHIWTMHRLQLTLIDGVLAIQLWSAVNSVNAKIVEKRKLHQIAKDMDAEFQDASELDIKKAAACGDVCCICLSSMSWIGLRCTHVKKLKCGHMYHTSCLREVVERARSMDTARCPMCRNTIHSADRQRRPPPPEQQQHPPLPPQEEQLQLQPPPLQPPPLQPQQPQQQQPPIGDEPPLFRFTASIPWLPAVSFEVVRRPDNDTVTVWRRFFGMTEAEEQMALQRLSDMFPQYDRNELLTALRERGSDQLVAEAILGGAYVPPTVR